MDLSQCQICKDKSDNISFFDVHHIKFRSESKANKEKIDNSKRNLVPLCPKCHRKVHLEEITIDRWYMSTSGRLLGWHYKNSSEYKFT